MERDPLKVRLFGYGVPYRVRFTEDGGVSPLGTGPAREAEDLARELSVLCGLGTGETFREEEAWAVSVPFGRCGIRGLPREYIRVFHCAEGYLDRLSKEGYEEVPVEEGREIRILPGQIVRVRARPAVGRRVVVAFQTEDRTPLVGNAAPFTLDGAVPEDYERRLVKCHAAFGWMQKAAEQDAKRFHKALDRFFGGMADRLARKEEAAQIQEAARQHGSYDVEDQAPLFARQHDLLAPEVIARIARRDDRLFRFPGMFGGIAALFNLIS